MPSEHPNNASGRTTAAGSIADAELDAYVPPDPMLEIDRDTMALLGELADLAGRDESRAVAAAHHAAVFSRPDRPPTGTHRTHPNPRRPPCASQ